MDGSVERIISLERQLRAARTDLANLSKNWELCERRNEELEAENEALRAELARPRHCPVCGAAEPSSSPAKPGANP